MPVLRKTWLSRVSVVKAGHHRAQQFDRQNYRFSQLFVVFIATSITCQEFHSLFSISRLRRLCNDVSDSSSKSEEMCQFFEKRGYPDSVVKAGHHRAQLFDRQSALQTSQKDKNDRIPFTLTFHPHNHAVKSIILNNLKLLQNDPETGRIFSQPPHISFNRDKNVCNFLVRRAPKTKEQPGTFKCARSRCKTCLFIVNTSKISGHKRSVTITDRFTCTSANVIYCITCTLCNKLYIGKTGRRPGDANFPFVNGRCHLKRSMPFLTVDYTLHFKEN